MVADTTAVLLAAGSGERLGKGNKALLPLGGLPLVSHALQALKESQSVNELILVMNPEDQDAFAAQWSSSLASLEVDHIVPGGDHRWLSSHLGCLASNQENSLLLVHDAARALVTPKTIDAVCAAARRMGCAIAAEPLADTLKKASPQRTVAATIPRDELWCAQTPQAAQRDLLLQAFAHWATDHKDTLPTDEAMLLEATGHQPALVPSPSTNFKITTTEDLRLAEALLTSSATSNHE